MSLCSKTRAGAKNPGTKSSVPARPGQTHLPKKPKKTGKGRSKTGKDVLIQEKDVLKEEKMF